MADAGIDFDIETPDLRSLLAGLKEIEPRLATSLRRVLRSSGTDVIDAQRKELGAGELRNRIAAGLRTRVTAGRTRQGVAIRSNGPRKGGANLARVMQQAVIRHPVFGSSKWVDQPGHPYFFEPVTHELRTKMRDRIEDAVQDALRALN